MDIRRIRAELRMGRPIYDLPMRATFYARVSTDQDEQLNSLENQVQYYTELIRSKKTGPLCRGILMRVSPVHRPSSGMTLTA